MLLRDVSGAFRPHRLACLMGASGAGKTTLMDCLAGRKTSKTLSVLTLQGGGGGGEFERCKRRVDG